MYSVRDEAPQGFDERSDSLQQAGDREQPPTEVGTDAGSDPTTPSTDGTGAPRRRRRRRRGGRGRGRGRSGATRPAEGSTSAADRDDDGDDAGAYDDAEGLSLIHI